MVKTAFIKTFSRLLDIAGYDLVRNSRRTHYSYHNLLDRLLERKFMFQFIQIGGCDGKSFDPLYPYLQSYKGKVHGVIVEPVESYVDEITDVYSGYKGIKILRKAIHTEKENMLFYRADMSHSDKLPEFAKGVASFNKSHLIKFNIPKEHIIEEEVPCISMMELIKAENIASLDLLQIDAEGYDAEIIKSLDFRCLKPSVIHFEHGLRDHTMDKKVFSEVVSLLNSQSYDVIIEDYDATAYLPELI